MMLTKFIKSDTVLCSILVLFLVTLYSYISVQGFWHDEIHTLAFIRGIDVYPFPDSDFNNITKFESVRWYKSLLELDNFSSNFYRNIIHEGHPPLYYLLLKIWTFVFGCTESGLRSFSLFTSLISLIFFSKIIKLITGEKNNIYTLLLAVSPFFVYYSIEARSYSLYFLLATITIYFALKHLTTPLKNQKSTYIILAGLFSILLIYTHYYGVFIYLILAIIIGVKCFEKETFYKSIILLIPLILFLPWFYIVKKQTNAHSSHWTDGKLSVSDSITEFIYNSIDLLISPDGSIKQVEIIVLSFAIILLLINFIVSDKFGLKNMLLFTLIYLFYGLEIIVFDFILDHHTIAISRYYFPLLIFILLAIIYCLKYGRYKWLNWMILLMILPITIGKSYDVICANSAKKQMYRETANFIDENYNPNDVKIVICPHGPTSLGIAYYLNKDFSIKGIDVNDLCNEYMLDSTLIIEQKLGVNTEPWNVDCGKEYINLTKINFIGIDLVKEK